MEPARQFHCDYLRQNPFLQMITLCWLAALIFNPVAESKHEAPLRPRLVFLY